MLAGTQNATRVVVGGCLCIPGFMGIFCSDLALHLDSPGFVLPSVMG